jgi:hypothetical protein
MEAAGDCILLLLSLASGQPTKEPQKVCFSSIIEPTTTWKTPVEIGYGTRTFQQSIIFETRNGGSVY